MLFGTPLNSARTRCLAFAVGAVLIVALPGCASGPKSDRGTAASTPQPPTESAEPTAAAAYYFGSVRQVDVSLGGPDAYWRVETDTTPTAQAALAALSFMGRKYRNQDRAIVLRIDAGPEGPPTLGPSHTPMINLVWNPTSGTVTTGLLPPGSVASRTLTLFVFRGFDVTHGPSTISEVTTESLTADSPQHSRLLLQVRDGTGLR